MKLGNVVRLSTKIESKDTNSEANEFIDGITK